MSNYEETLYKTLNSISAGLKNNASYTNFIPKMEFNAVFHIDEKVYTEEIDRLLVSDIITTVKNLFEKYGIKMNVLNIQTVSVEYNELNSEENTLYDYYQKWNEQFNPNLDSAKIFIFLTSKKPSGDKHDPAGFHYYYGNMKGKACINLYKDFFYNPWILKKETYKLSKTQVICHEIGHYLGASHDLDEYGGKKSIMHSPAYYIKNEEDLFFSNKSFFEFEERAKLEQWLDDFEVKLSINNEKIIFSKIGETYDYEFKISEGILKDIVLYYHPYDINEYTNFSLISFVLAFGENIERTENMFKYTWKQDYDQLPGWYAYYAIVDVNGKEKITNPVIIVLED